MGHANASRASVGFVLQAVVTLGLIAAPAAAPNTALADPPRKVKGKHAAESETSRSERVKAIMSHRQQQAERARKRKQAKGRRSRKRLVSKDKRMETDRKQTDGKRAGAQAGDGDLTRRVQRSRKARRETSRAQRGQMVEHVKRKRDKSSRRKGDEGIAGREKQPSGRRFKARKQPRRKDKAAPARAPGRALGRTHRRRCVLVQTEVPRGGRIEVKLPAVGRAPVVRIDGRVARMLSRRRTRIAVQVPRNSNGGAVTVQDGDGTIRCGSLRILGLN